MQHLDVYLNTDLVGRLTREQDRLEFVYSKDYLISPEAVPLSRRMPLGPEVYGDETVRAFFANLLPEGDVLSQVARQLGLSRDNVFGLLEGIGGDCAGAVSVLPPDRTPVAEGWYKRLTGEELASILATLPLHPFLADREGVRLSLAGAQNKLPVYHDQTGFHLPHGQAPSSHILKTAIPHLENTVANEVFCMSLAREVGLNVPSVAAIQVGEEQVFMIERYDRVTLPSGRLVRIHQEDFCQALGTPPAMKYETEGGPGFGDCFALVRQWSTEPLPDVDALLQWTLFNFLIGNADAHGKNLSFLYQNGTIRLAPFYDLISTAAYEGQVNNKFAMRLGNQKNPRYLSVRNLEIFADQVGIAPRAVFAELKRLADKVKQKAEELAASYLEDAERRSIESRIATVIADRTRMAGDIVHTSRAGKV